MAPREDPHKANAKWHSRLMDACRHVADKRGLASSCGTNEAAFNAWLSGSAFPTDDEYTRITRGLPKMCGTLEQLREERTGRLEEVERRAPHIFKPLTVVAKAPPKTIEKETTMPPKNDMDAMFDILVAEEKASVVAPAMPQTASLFLDHHAAQKWDPVKFDAVSYKIVLAFLDKLGKSQ